VEIQRQMEAMDRQIDQLVYALYGLTADEIALVEAATACGFALAGLAIVWGTRNPGRRCAWPGLS